eukprot:6909830-Prymnesium_polylepis.1
MHFKSPKARGLKQIGKSLRRTYLVFSGHDRLVLRSLLESRSRRTAHLGPRQDGGRRAGQSRRNADLKAERLG